MGVLTSKDFNSKKEKEKEEKVIEEMTEEVEEKVEGPKKPSATSKKSSGKIWRYKLLSAPSGRSKAGFYNGKGETMSLELKDGEYVIPDSMPEMEKILFAKELERAGFISLTTEKKN